MSRPAHPRAMTPQRPGRTRTAPPELPGPYRGLSLGYRVVAFMMRKIPRVNYLLSVEVRLPRDEMVDRLTAIIFAAFHSP